MNTFAGWLKAKRVWQLALVLVVVAATAAYAQQESASMQQERDAGKTVKLASAQSLVGKTILSSDGQEVGEIEYLLINGMSGAVEVALVRGNEELEESDAGEDALYAVPFASMTVKTGDEKEFTTRIGPDKLRSAPRVREDGIESFSEPMVVTQVYDYYGVPRTSRQGESDPSRDTGNGSGYDSAQENRQPDDESRAAARARSDEREHMSHRQDDASGRTRSDSSVTEGVRQEHPPVLIARDVVSVLVPGFVTIDRLKGAEVTTAEDDSVGEIDEVVINLDDGRVAYVLLDAGGFLGIGEQTVPYPLESLRWNADAEKYVTGIERDSVKNAPSVPRSGFPASVARSDLERFHASYAGREGQQQAGDDYRMQKDSSGKKDGDRSGEDSRKY